MALTLKEYIKMSYKRPNKAVLRGLGASEELIEYLCKTPWNTNLNVIDSMIGENVGGAAVVGTAVVGTATVG